jgi:hypothetical protein
MMQTFKNRYWYSKDIAVVFPRGFTCTREEVAHCVLVLGCLLNALDHGFVGDRDDVLKDVYGPDKEPLSDLAELAYNHYKDDKSLMLGWIAWLLHSTYYGGDLDVDKAREAALADLAALKRTAGT